MGSPKAQALPGFIVPDAIRGRTSKTFEARTRSKNPPGIGIAGNFHAIPMPGGFFDLVRASKVFDVLPRIASGTIKPGNAWAFGDPIDSKVSSAYNQNVTRAALN